jgi:hypothetical protein
MYSKLWKLAGFALTLAACASGIQQNDAAFSPAPPAEASTLIVRNDYFGETDVYAVMGHTRTRIGSVGAGRTATFRLPRTLLMRSEIRFQIDPVGPVAPFTLQPISIGPGNNIELSVAPALQMSSYAIVNR